MDTRICEQLQRARQLTDSLFQLVHSDALYDRPIPEWHRPIFYLGHLEAFDRNMIGECHSDFDRLFAFGIDPISSIGGKLPEDRPRDWPRAEEVRRYNAETRAFVDETITHGGVESERVLWAIVEHRLMHAETLCYLFHQLPHEKKATQTETIIDGPPLSPRAIDVPAGAATLGLSTTSDVPFGWDNEFAPITVAVPAFSIDAYNTTNGQFLKFIQADGYKERTFWDADAWTWIQREGIRHPKFWKLRNDAWFYRTMFADVPLPLSWPVYVSHAEASAYARWKGRSLPTESQFHRAASGTEHGNFGCGRWNPLPAGSNRAGDSSYGVTDLVGNGWEWTSTVFEPFPDFEPFSFYPGYSADFFDGRHYVTKGASPRTPSRLVRSSFRNWFQPHYPNVYATFRCAES